MSCEQNRDLMNRRLEGTISAPELEELEAHIAHCAECRDACDRLNQASSVLAGTLRPSKSPTEARRAIQADLAYPGLGEFHAPGGTAGCPTGPA